MFKPAPSKEHKGTLSTKRERLAKALNSPATVAEPPELAELVAEQARGQTEIEAIKRMPGTVDLEGRAHRLVNLQTQQELRGSQIKDLLNAHSRKVEAARSQREAEITRVGDEAEELLADVSGDFMRQHREQLEAVVGQYAINYPNHGKTVVSLIPWFLDYLRKIREFRQHRHDPEVVLKYLDQALEGRDFLMVLQCATLQCVT